MKKIPSERVIRELEGLRENKDLPEEIRADNDPEFIINKMQKYGEKSGVLLKHIHTGKPSQNGHLERLYSKHCEDVPDAFLCERLSQVSSMDWRLRDIQIIF